MYSIYFTALFLLTTFNNEVNGNNYELTRVAPIELAAVGRVASLGELYDARSDKFLHLSILKNALPNTSIVSTQNIQTKLHYTFANTLEEKFQTMDISAELKMSIMSGLFKLEGSGTFFKDTKRSAKSAKASVVNSISTEYQKISITETSFKSMINLDALEQIDATHVVVGIQWGGSVFISVEDTNIDERSQQIVQGNLKAKLVKLANKISGEAQVYVNEKERSELNKFNFAIYGDILPDEVPQNLFDALKFLKNVSKVLQTANSGKGKAMKYTLIPVNLLRQLMKVKAKINSIIYQVDESTVQHCVKLFDDMNKFDQKLNDLVDNVNHFEKYIQSNKTDEIKSLQFNFKIYQAEVQKNLSEHLILVRSGKGTSAQLLELMIQATKHPYSWHNVEMYFKNLSSDIKIEISFLKYLQKLNVILIDKDQALDEFLYDYYQNDIYILSYSGNNPRLFGKPMDIMLELIDVKKNNGTNDIFAAINNQINNISNQTKLMFYRKMKLFKENYDENWTLHDYNRTKLWSLSLIQKQLERLLNDPVKEQIKNKIKSIETNLIPIGFVYTQLPNTSTPYQLWPQFKWLDVTLEYSGLFFRAEGEESQPFGQIQQQNQSWISDVHLNGVYFDSWTGYHGKEYYTSLNQTKWIDVDGQKVMAVTYLQFYTTGGEVRPKNTAIKIFKRIE